MVPLIGDPFLGGFGRGLGGNGVAPPLEYSPDLLFDPYMQELVDGEDFTTHTDCPYIVDMQLGDAPFPDTTRDATIVNAGTATAALQCADNPTDRYAITKAAGDAGLLQANSIINGGNPFTYVGLWYTDSLVNGKTWHHVFDASAILVWRLRGSGTGLGLEFGSGSVSASHSDTGVGWRLYVVTCAGLGANDLNLYYDSDMVNVHDADVTTGVRTPTAAQLNMTIGKSNTASYTNITCGHWALYPSVLNQTQRQAIHDYFTVTRGITLLT